MSQQASPALPPAKGTVVDVTTLVLSLQQGAFVMMGLKSEEGISTDMRGARVQIDLLAMLQEKTQDNLSDDEEKLLRSVLFELRTAWVEQNNKAKQ
jgi:hypothetical protein